MVRARSSSRNVGEMRLTECPILARHEQPRLHRRAGLAHVELAGVALLEQRHHPAHVLDRGRAGLGDDRVDRGRQLGLAPSGAAGRPRSPRLRPPRPRPARRGRPCSYMSIDSRRCLIIFCSTSVTSTSSSGGFADAAQLDVAILQRRLDQADRVAARRRRRPSWRRPAPALMSSRIMGLFEGLFGKPTSIAGRLGLLTD